MTGRTADSSAKHPSPESGPVVVCLTGASGTIYGRRLVAVLSHHCEEVHVVASPNALHVLRLEEGIEWAPGQDLEPLLREVGPFRADRIRVHDADMASPLASGTSRFQAACVLPCSMSTLASVATGVTSHLVHRICDVALKERRPLVLAVREMPFSTRHIRNMLVASELGATVMACAPGFYHHPRSVRDLVDFVVDRVAAHMNIHLGLVQPWEPA